MTITSDKKLNSGRIVDCLLGGEHHYPADVEATNRLLTLYPDYPKVFRGVRDFHGRAAGYMHTKGVDRFLVFGAGIPTLGAVHEVVPEAKVLYSDLDLENVELGGQILADNPRCDYAFADVTDLSTLDPHKMNTVLGTDGPLGMNVAGVVCFLEDDVLTKVFEELFEFAPTGSYLAVDFDSFGMPRETVKRREYFLRTPDTIRPLLGKWQPTAHGILPISLWRADELNVQDPAKQTFHYVTILTK